MLCDECGKNQATYHEIRKINGRRTEVHLCDACRRKNGYDVLPVSGMGDVFGSFDEFFGNGMREDETNSAEQTSAIFWKPAISVANIATTNSAVPYCRSCSVFRKK